MKKKQNTLNDREIAAGYARLGLQKMYNEPYNPEQQYEKFKQCTIYTDNSPCYATGDTRTDRRM
jgi:hypothetical protein